MNLYIDTTVSGFTIQQEYPCTVASFIGYNTYVAANYKVKNQSISAPGNHPQGYWGFEFAANIFGFPYNLLTSGQAPVQPRWLTPYLLLRLFPQAHV